MNGTRVITASFATGLVLMVLSCSSAYRYGIEEDEINDFDRDAYNTHIADDFYRHATDEALFDGMESDLKTRDVEAATWEAERTWQAAR